MNQRAFSFIKKTFLQVNRQISRQLVPSKTGSKYDKFKEISKGIKPGDISPEYCADNRCYLNHSIRNLLSESLINVDVTPVKTYLSCNASLNSKQWDEVTVMLSHLNPTISPNMINVTLMKLCCELSSYITGESLIEHLKQCGKPLSIAVISWFFLLCGLDSKASKSDFILKIIQEIRERYPVLDPQTTTHMVVALSTTPEWQNGFEYVKHINEKDSKLLSLSNSVLINAAFKAENYSIAIRTLGNLFNENLVPYELAYDNLFTIHSSKYKESSSNYFEHIVKPVLKMWREHYFYPSQPLIEKIKIFFDDSMKSWQGTLSMIGFSGNCPVCGSFLEKESLSKEEYTELRTKFFQRVLFGKNIFLKTTPKELAAFEKFLAFNAPFDVVIDGLNVYYTLNSNKPRDVKAKQLLAAVKHFSEQNKKVLLIGKHHLRSMNVDVMNEIKKHSLLFTTDNISKDDPFILYAALYSGYNTKVLSRDMLRDHIYKLDDRLVQNLFLRWQQLHQIEIIGFTKTGKVKLQEPATHVFGAQWDDKGFHIPYNDGTLYSTYQIPSNWLCFSKS